MPTPGTGTMATLINANTRIPTKKLETFSTFEDNQMSMEIHILQGNQKKAADNLTIGHFQIDDIMPARRGEPQIEITFGIDSNGTLSILALNKRTGKEKRIKI